MLYEDSGGRIYSAEEVEAWPFWKIEKMQIHIFEEDIDEQVV